MTLKIAIEHRIKDLCHKRNLNPNSLAYLCGMDRSTIYSILSGKSDSPQVVTIKKICDGLDITLAQFFDCDVFNSLEQEIR